MKGFTREKRRERKKGEKRAPVIEDFWRLDSADVWQRRVFAASHVSIGISLPKERWGGGGGGGGRGRGEGRRVKEEEVKVEENKDRERGILMMMMMKMMSFDENKENHRRMTHTRARGNEGRGIIRRLGCRHSQLRL